MKLFTKIFKLGKKEDYVKKTIFLEGHNSYIMAICSESYATGMIKMIEDRLSDKSINSYNDEMLLRDILHRAESIQNWSHRIQEGQDWIIDHTRE